MKQRAVIAPSARATRVKGSSPVGERVRARRIETGLTQAELAGERFSKSCLFFGSSTRAVESQLL